MKMPTPIPKIRFRPYRSASDAAGEDERGERQRVRVDHPLQLRKLASRSRWIRGSATWTIVTSTSSMNVAPQTATSVHQFAVARGAVTLTVSTAGA